jgi:2-hydroxy-3-oxopropionate reductase
MTRRGGDVIATEMSVGFVGVGHMGLPMAQCLLKGMVDLTVYDVRAEAMRPLVQAGAKPAASVREVSEACDLVFLSLPTLDTFRQVVAGPEGLRRDARMKIVVNTCTVGQPFIEEMHEALVPDGVILIDAPVSGGPPAAEAGTLSLLVSGDASATEEIRPLLLLLGRTVTLAGSKPGAAQVLKLANNLLSFVAMAATAEVLVMATKAGLDPEVTIAAFNASTGRNSATVDKFPRTVLTRTFRQGVDLQISAKDLDLAMAQADVLGVPMWVCSAARQLFKSTLFAGSPRDDAMTIVRYVERAARFEMPKTRSA